MMRCSAICVLLLAISEPLLIHAKVVLVVPRQVRRSPVMPWRPPQMHHKKSFAGNNFHRGPYFGSALAHRYHNKKPLRPYPQGGDDFDQGHEPVNHVHIPYGKDISHSISFGKGYIPYENSVKSSSLPYVPDRYVGAHQPVAPDFPPTGFTSVGQEYAASHTSATRAHEGPHVDSYFSDMEGSTHGHDPIGKYYTVRSIEKDLILGNQQVLGPAIKDLSGKNTESFLAKDASSSAYGHAADSPSGAVILPEGIPPATIAGNKDGIVLRDSVSMDEYQKKLEELTKNWPSVLTGTNVPASFSAPIHQSFPTGGFVGSDFAGGGTAWLAGLQAQSKQGYAVREEQGDHTTHDFRTMPIHAAGAPSYAQLPFVHAARAFAPNFHG